MLIVGAGGFAKEVLSCLTEKNPDHICFYDDVNQDRLKVFEKYSVLKNEEEVTDFFKKRGNSFTIGIGGPKLRMLLYNKFVALGGEFKSLLSERAFIGLNKVILSEGVVILPGCNISNDVTIGLGSMVYYNTNITHDCNIGNFVEISPGVNILGRAKVGDYASIGAGAVILPDITIGEGAVIGAGAIVTKDVPPNTVVVGNPAKVLKKL